VLWRHVFRNALIPVITVVGLELGTLLSGSIIAETVFAWPGSGSLLISAIQARDWADHRYGDHLHAGVRDHQFHHRHPLCADRPEDPLDK
jgi:ABC-type antimicrobial peptide transport system permease subunit